MNYPHSTFEAPMHRPARHSKAAWTFIHQAPRVALTAVVFLVGAVATVDLMLYLVR
ncbi:MAG: hypothetical protein V4731_09835 [Pseudomonadota bacterium]